MARETAYRLRRRAWSESFVAAWDAAMRRPLAEYEKSQTGAARKVTTAELKWRIDGGLWQVRMYRGKFILAWQKPDDSTLFRLLTRLDRARPSPRFGKARP